MRSLIFSASVTAILIGALPAQAAWTRLSPTSAPGTREDVAATADLGSMLIFGGSSDGSLSQIWHDELWRFDGQSWTQLMPVSGSPPPARWGAAAAYDLARGRLVLFGGQSPGQTFGEIWEWDGATWSSPALAVKPAPRSFPSMAYEAHGGRTILFGGVDRTGNAFGDTWAWNGTAWTRLAPVTSPSPRWQGQMVYDSLRHRMVYFGGRDANGVLGDTWSFDGQNWTRIATATVPNGTGAFGHGMVYDTVRDRCVVFGGSADDVGRFDTTWEFDGVDWVLRPANNGPLQRMNHAMAHVLGTGKTLMFGGSATAWPAPAQLDDTWEYQTNARPSFSISGAGCPTTLGSTPSLSALQLPWIGTNLVLEIGNFPPGAAPFLMAGFTQVNIPLAVIGAPACVVTADPLAIAGVPISSSTGLPTLSLPVPPVASLIGAVLYAQGLVFEPGGGGHLSLTPRGDMVFGAP